MSARGTGTRLAVALLAGSVLFGSGCARQTATEQASTDTTQQQAAAGPTVERAREAGEMAAAIEKEPSRAEEILQQHGMTQDQFQDLLYEIAQDPELTAAYEAARGG